MLIVTSFTTQDNERTHRRYVVTTLEKAIMQLDDALYDAIPDKYHEAGITSHKRERDALRNALVQLVKVIVSS